MRDKTHWRPGKISLMYASSFALELLLLDAMDWRCEGQRESYGEVELEDSATVQHKP